MGAGLRGRPRKPTKLRLLEGNRGKRALPKDEPQPEACEPKLPATVKRDPVALAEWQRIASLTLLKHAAVLTLADGPMLEATSRAYSEYESADAALRGYGSETYSSITQGGGVIHRPYPEVAIRADAWRRWVAGLTHFGLSPATRGKVKTVGGDSGHGDEAEAFFK